MKEASTSEKCWPAPVVLKKRKGAAKFIVSKKCLQPPRSAALGWEPEFRAIMFAKATVYTLIGLRQSNPQGLTKRQSRWGTPAGSPVAGVVSMKQSTRHYVRLR